MKVDQPADQPVYGLLIWETSVYWLKLDSGSIYERSTRSKSL